MIEAAGRDAYSERGSQMTGHIGFSYTGTLFLVLLFLPNIVWAQNKPMGYTSEGENKTLLFLERIGEALTCCCALIFWLVGAFVLMAMYEVWWIRYFRSERKLTDFYSSLCGIPLAGATLPVAAFFLLGIYGRVIWMIIATVILGIGHVGIHAQHRKEAGAKLWESI